MENKVIIKCLNGQGAIVGPQKEWIYTEPDNILVGRAVDNQIIIKNEGNYKQISRYQAQFTIRPPKIYVSDFGSKNGTFVNGVCIGKREKNETVEEGQKRVYPLHELKNGDIFSLGGVNSLIEFQVEIFEAPESICPETDYQNLELQEENIYRIKENNAALLKNKLLGKGGFGAVYLAEDVNTKDKYAIKEFKPEVKVNDRMIQFFMREADLLKQMKHPNIVKVFDNYFDVKDENLCIVMEYCSGGDLFDYMNKKGGKLDLKEATDIILTLLNVLEYVHTVEVEVKDAKGNLRKEHGVVHRDIKPQNVLFTGDGKIKLSDFGLAKAFDLAGASGATSDGQWSGSLPYVSRRQIKKFRYVKPEADVFSLAAVYYQMLTGEYIRDFQPEDCRIPQMAILKKRLIPIRERNDSIPQELARVIDHVLQEEDYDDDAEFTTAKMFGRQICQALNMI